jgi:HAD superfamily hydrolase (TIGR01549 family)
MKYETIFFDFDGVILDSVNVKTEAFAAMFRHYGPAVEQAVVAFHLANGGVSRFKKFEHYYNHILGKPITQKELQTLGEQFSSLALQGVLESPYIPGALETLCALKEKGIPCFVVSGTPDEEIKLIVEKKRLSQYFQEVHGSPRKKAEILLDILVRYDLTAGQCLFIGDAMTDYEAAQECGTAFLGIVNDSGDSPFPCHTNVSNSLMVPELTTDNMSQRQT